MKTGHGFKKAIIPHCSSPLHLAAYFNEMKYLLVLLRRVSLVCLGLISQLPKFEISPSSTQDPSLSVLILSGRSNREDLHGEKYGTLAFGTTSVHIGWKTFSHVSEVENNWFTSSQVLTMRNMQVCLCPRDVFLFVYSLFHSNSNVLTTTPFVHFFQKLTQQYYKGTVLRKTNPSEPLQIYSPTVKGISLTNNVELLRELL